METSQDLFQKPDILTLGNLLVDRLFIIPDYQRPYSWTKKQREALFDDIKIAKMKNKQHFMSTIVYVKTKVAERIGSEQYYYYEVVDGQQRLTSLIILLKAIVQELSNKDDDEKWEKQKLQNQTLVRGNKEKQLILLQTNHKEKELFNAYLNKGIIPKKSYTLPEKNLKDAFEESEKFVKEWKNQGNEIIELLSVVKNNLLFLAYDLSDESVVYTVFDVLNSRGLSVINLDKAKSLFLSQIFESNASNILKKLYVDKVKQSWTEIYDLLGIKEFNSDDILKYASTFLSAEIKGKIDSSEDALNTLQDRLKADISQIAELSSLLVSISKQIKNIMNNPILTFFSSITQLRFLYTAINLSESLTDDDRFEIFEKYQIVSFVIYGLYGKDSKYSVGEFVRLGQEIFNCKIETPKEMEKEKKKEFENLSFKDKILKRLSMIVENYPVDKIEEEFENRNCYKDWYDELKYLLYRVELFLSKKKKPTQIWNGIFDSSIKDTIEHIMPETKTKDWEGKCRSGMKYDKVVIRLGNLMLLPKGMNSECGQKPFKDKKEIYKKSKLFIADDVIYTDANNTDEREDWNIDEIEAREKRYFKYIKEIFKIE